MTMPADPAFEHNGVWFAICDRCEGDYVLPGHCTWCDTTPIDHHRETMKYRTLYYRTRTKVSLYQQRRTRMWLYIHVRKARPAQCLACGARTYLEGDMCRHCIDRAEPM